MIWQQQVSVPSVAAAEQQTASRSQSQTGMPVLHQHFQHMFTVKLEASSVNDGRIEATSKLRLQVAVQDGQVQDRAATTDDWSELRPQWHPSTTSCCWHTELGSPSVSGEPSNTAAHAASIITKAGQPAASCLMLA